MIFCVCNISVRLHQIFTKHLVRFVLDKWINSRDRRLGKFLEHVAKRLFFKEFLTSITFNFRLKNFINYTLQFSLSRPNCQNVVVNEFNT